MLGKCDIWPLIWVNEFMVVWILQCWEKHTTRSSMDAQRGQLQCCCLEVFLVFTFRVLNIKALLLNIHRFKGNINSAASHTSTLTAFPFDFSLLFVLSLHLIYCLTAPWITSLSLCFLTYIHSQGKPLLQLRFTGEKHLSIHCPHIVTCFRRSREANVQRHNKHIIDLSVSGWDETITLFHKDLEIHTQNRILLRDTLGIEDFIPS